MFFVATATKDYENHSPALASTWQNLELNRSRLRRSRHLTTWNWVPNFSVWLQEFSSCKNHRQEGPFFSKYKFDLKFFMSKLQMAPLVTLIVSFILYYVKTIRKGNLSFSTEKLVLQERRADGATCYKNCMITYMKEFLLLQ